MQLLAYKQAAATESESEQRQQQQQLANRQLKVQAADRHTNIRESEKKLATNRRKSLRERSQKKKKKQETEYGRESPHKSIWAS